MATKSRKQQRIQSLDNRDRKKFFFVVLAVTLVLLLLLYSVYSSL
jgi:hypothetical protein